MKSWTIRKLLNVGFAAPLIVIVVLSIAFIYSLGTIDRDIHSIVASNVPGLVQSNEAATTALIYRGDTLRHIMSDDAAEMKALDENCSALGQKLLQTLQAYRATIQTDENRELFDRVAPAWETYVALAIQARQLSTEGKKKEAVELVRTKGGAAMVAFQKSINALVGFSVEASNATNIDVAHTIVRTRGLVGSLAVGAFALSLGAAFYITRTVGRTIRRVSNALDDTSAHVTSASTQVSGASQSLAEGASEQAASLEETSASIEELASMTKRNAESAQTTNELSRQMRTAADTCSADMHAMDTAMAEIKTSSTDISKIIKTIDEIAFQTNILALNAAVEAARAGEAGMGFAVVAEEVRSLAQRSAQSAKETAEKIEVAISKSEHGVAISSKVGESLALIVEKARKVDSLIAEIASASQEQSQGIAQVNTTVSQMDQVTQSNAGNAEETAAAAEELSAQAVAMQDAVAELRNLIDGTTARAMDSRGTTDLRQNSAASHDSSNPHGLRRPSLARPGEEAGLPFDEAKEGRTR